MRALRGRAAMATAALLAVIPVTVVGCTSARNALGTNSSPCYRALPVAEDAVHDRGAFNGVRLVTAKGLLHPPRYLDELRARAGGMLKDVCVVSYSGSYTLDQVEKPVGAAPPGGTGRYAIVVVNRPSNKLLGTFVRITLPMRFHHLASGRR
jgi:hypothetical protein